MDRNFNDIEFIAAADPDFELIGRDPQLGVRRVCLADATNTRISAAARIMGRRALLVGDSLMSINTSATDTIVSNRAVGMFTWANILLAQRFELVSNQGVSGDKTADTLARMSQILAIDADYVFVLVGINDVTNSVPASTITTNLWNIYAPLLAKGRKVVALTLLPSTGVNTAAKRAAHAAVNAWIRNVAATVPGIILVDTYWALADMSTGDPISGDTTDGTHPGQRGAIKLGRCIFDVFDALLPFNVLPPSTNFDWTNLVYNPMAYGNNAGGANGFIYGAGISGNGPSGWRAGRSGTGTAVCSKVARSVKPFRQGDWAQQAFTSAADADYTYFEWRSDENTQRANSTAYALGAAVNVPGYTGVRFVCTTAGTSAASLGAFDATIGNTTTDGTVTWTCAATYAIGSTLVGQCAFETDSFSGAHQFDLQVSAQNAGLGNLIIAIANYSYGESASAWNTYGPLSGVLRTPPLVVPADTVRIINRLYIRGANGVTGNVRVNSVAVQVVA